MRSCKSQASSLISTLRGKGKKAWTEQEDNLLRELVLLHGTTNWTLLAQYMTDPSAPEGSEPGRSGKQCRERWHNHLNPNISKVEWTATEDATIVFLQKKWGNQWANIAKYLPGRSDNAVKNRYHATCRNKYSQMDFAALNLPFFVEDAEVVADSTVMAAASSSSSRGTSHEDKFSSSASSEEEDFNLSDDELDFDQHVQKIKSYTSTLSDLRDDMASSPLTNASMSIGELALDELMDDDDADMGMGGSVMHSIAVEPVAFTSFKWGSGQGFSDAHEGSQPNGCFTGAMGGFSMSGMMCDFNMGSSSYDKQHEAVDSVGFYSSDEAQPALVCEVVSAQQQQQQSHFSPAMAFCQPRW